MRTIHKRSFKFLEEVIFIEDELTNSLSGSAFFHIHPDYKIRELDKGLYQLKEGVRIQFTNFANIKIETYQMADSFHKHKTGNRFVVSFNSQLTTQLLFRI